MVTYNIALTISGTTTEITVKSEAAMWKYLRSVRDGMAANEFTPGIRALVTDCGGNTFKDITFRRNAKGKIEMPNAYKPTCRYTKVKAAKLAAQAKAEARKAAKRETDRRYRERKKAAKAAALAAEQTPAE